MLRDRAPRSGLLSGGVRPGGPISRGPRPRFTSPYSYVRSGYTPGNSTQTSNLNEKKSTENGTNQVETGNETDVNDTGKNLA